MTDAASSNTHDLPRSYRLGRFVNAVVLGLAYVGLAGLIGYFFWQVEPLWARWLLFLLVTPPLCVAAFILSFGDYLWPEPEGDSWVFVRFLGLQMLIALPIIGGIVWLTS